MPGKGYKVSLTVVLSQTHIRTLEPTELIEPFADSVAPSLTPPEQSLTDEVCALYLPVGVDFRLGVL
jgi:hypothetical protein